MKTAEQEAGFGAGLQGWRKKRTSIAAGIFLAVLAELLIAWYGAGRGYGSGSQGERLEPVFIQDYQVEDGRWRAAGEVPMILFQAEKSPGHIRFIFREPLAEDTIVTLYYADNPEASFDVFCRKERYMMAGTREASLPVPRGDFHWFWLEIRGEFVPEQAFLVPAVPDDEIVTGTVLGLVKPWRLVMMGMFLSAGLWIYRGVSGSSGSSGRRVWLDLARVLAAVLVIIVHVTEPAVLTMPPGSRLRLIARVFLLGAWTCNVLFVLVSGALLLPWKEEPAGVFVRKRLLGVVLPLAVYAGFYVYLMCITKTGTISWIICYLRTVVGGTFVEAPHFWLVYVLAGLYLLVIPFRYMLKSLPERMEKLLTVMILALLTVRTASLWSGQEVGISCFLGDWPGIFLLGYFLTRDWMRRYDRILIAAGAGAFALAFWIQGIRPDYKGIVCSQSILMTAMTMAVFVAVMGVERWPEPMARVLHMCSRYSYSVLLVHWYVLRNFIYNGLLSSRMPGTIQLVAQVVLCLGLSLGIAVVVDHMAVGVLERGVSRCGSCLRLQFTGRGTGIH